MAETREDVLHRDSMPLSRLVELQEHELQRLRAKLQEVRESLAFTQRSDFEASRDWDALTRAVNDVLAALGGDE